MSPMTKNMWREIRANLGRFIAIILIILLGTLIFVGVKATGPALNDSMDQTVKTAKLADIQMLSTTGFTNKDVRTAEKIAHAQAEPVKFKFALGGQDENVVALYGFNPGAKQNQLSLRSGRLPKQSNEIVLDQRAKTDYGYRLGDNYRFAKSAKLKHRNFKIVGFADSPQYIDNTTRGAANIGDGTVRYFAYIPAKQMNLSVATMLTVRFSSLQNLNSDSTTYKQQVKTKLKQLKTVFKNRRTTRERELSASATAPIDRQQRKLNQAKQQIKQAKLQITAQSHGTISTTPAISQQEKVLQTSQTKLDTARKQAKNAVKTTYTWQTRSDLPGFSAFSDSSDRIAAIANVFPVFFFLIAALITFTTISRMVTEARGQIGIFKALGYSKISIAKNYLFYALMAGLIGGILGSIIGNLTLPRFVISLYNSSIPMKVTVPIMWGLFSLALIFSLIATVEAAGYVVTRELVEKPAELMRPRAPKSAKRILLERITPLWKRLSFNQKVSYRNLFRYKSRMFMTIVGIAGGTALLLTGFGLRDSIGGTANMQYGQVLHYDATVTLAHAGQSSKALKVLGNSSKFQSAARVQAVMGKVKNGSKQLDEVNLYTPLSNHFADYVTLSHKLTNKGIVVSQKIADELKVRPGESLSFTSTDGDKAKIQVAAVTPNYMGSFAYMSPAAYQTAFKKAPKVNTLFVKLTNPTTKHQNQLAHSLLADGDALATTFTTDLVKNINTMTGTLSSVVLIIILLSGILSFVVLYNLTNINVSERMRELSTIKVLGFYDNEVTMYIVRENIVLTIAGIFLGYFAGWGLLTFILHQAATSQVIFPVIIHWSSFVASTLLMIGFNAIVMLFTHRKLQRVDMIEALKGNE